VQCTKSFKFSQNKGYKWQSLANLEVLILFVVLICLQTRYDIGQNQVPCERDRKKGGGLRFFGILNLLSVYVIENSISIDFLE